MHLPVLERDVVFLAAAAHPALEVLRQRVDHRDAHAVQAARELVTGVGGELSARVQPGEDQLDAAHLLFRVDVHRHAAAVVDDLERPVLVEGHFDLAAMARERFVDAVVDDFVSEVVGPTGVGVHARATPDGLESAQDFNVLSGVGLAHSWIGPRARVGGKKRANGSRARRPVGSKVCEAEPSTRRDVRAPGSVVPRASGKADTLARRTTNQASRGRRCGWIVRIAPAYRTRRLTTFRRGVLPQLAPALSCHMARKRWRCTASGRSGAFPRARVCLSKLGERHRIDR